MNISFMKVPEELICNTYVLSLMYVYNDIIESKDIQFNTSNVSIEDLIEIYNQVLLIDNPVPSTGYFNIKLSSTTLQIPLFYDTVLGNGVLNSIHFDKLVLFDYAGCKFNVIFGD